jgi:hypothetical protein
MRADTVWGVNGFYDVNMFDLIVNSTGSSLALLCSQKHISCQGTTFCSPRVSCRYYHPKLLLSADVDEHFDKYCMKSSAEM